jgi:pimeloyl-ACP methyl ester carboxylesterase
MAERRRAGSSAARTRAAATRAGSTRAGSPGAESNDAEPSRRRPGPTDPRLTDPRLTDSRSTDTGSADTGSADPGQALATPLTATQTSRAVAHWRPDDGVLALGVGLAAAGMGAVLGLAAERIAVARVIRPAEELGEPGDGRGGPALGSLRGEARVVLSREVPLHVEVDPADEGAPELTVVLSHGYALNLDSWHYQRLALRGRYRLVFWDQRGHGRSGTGPLGSSTIDQVGEDLGAVIDAVAPDGPLVLLGHSMGGMTVMSLAAQRPEIFADRVLAVGLLSTSAGGLGGFDLGLSGIGRLGMKMAPVAARMLARQPNLVARGRRLGSDLEGLLVRRYSFASPVPPQLITFAARMIAQTRMEVISDFLPTFSRHDKRDALAVLHGHEVLVMVGDSDLITPAEQSADIVRLLPGAEHVVVPGSGHLLPLEHPDLVSAHLDELLIAAESILRATSRPTRRANWGRRTVTPIRQRWPLRWSQRATDRGPDRSPDRSTDHSTDKGSS